MEDVRAVTSAPWAQRLLGFVLAIFIAGALPAAAADLAPGAVVHGSVELAGKQVVLPEGDWIVAGRAAETLPSLAGVPYGAIDSLVLFQLAAPPAQTGAAFVIPPPNSVAIR